MRTIVFAAIAVFSTSALAEDFGGLDVAARSIETSGKSTKIVYTVHSSRAAPVGGLYVACSLYDRDGAPVGSAEGIASNIPPGEEVVGVIKTTTAATKAVCRPTGFTSQ